MKSKIVPIMSVVIGFLAFALTFLYLKSEKDKLRQRLADIEGSTTKIKVMAAKRDIPAGTAIKPADLGTLNVAKAGVGARAVKPEMAEMLFGKKTLFSIRKKDPILWSDIEGGLLSASGLGPIINIGMRAISLPVGNASAVSGMVNPSDRVDILGTFSFPSKKIPGEMETVTLTVLQDVTILATGQRLAKDSAGGGQRSRNSYGTVTVEVTLREAELLVFAQQLKGRLTLALRNPEDVSFESNMPEVNFDYLENSLPELNLFRQKNIRQKRNLKTRARRPAPARATP